MNLKQEEAQTLRELLQELPELLADYMHCAVDNDGGLDNVRDVRIRKVQGMVKQLRNSFDLD
jgi:hypothetical protein